MQETPEPDASSQESASTTTTNISNNNNNKNHSSSNEDVQQMTSTEDGAGAGVEMKPDLIGDLTNLKNERNASGAISDVADVKADPAVAAPDSPPERAPLRRPFATAADESGSAGGGMEKGELDGQIKEQADNG